MIKAPSSSVPLLVWECAEQSEILHHCFVLPARVDLQNGVAAYRPIVHSLSLFIYIYMYI